MAYNDEIYEEIIRKTNIVELIGQDVRLKRTGRDYLGLCPFHAEKTPSFHVSPEKQVYYCFGCHAGGNAFTYLMEYHNYSYREALEYLAEEAGVEVPHQQPSEEARAAAERKSVLLEIYKKAAGFYYYRLKNPAGELGLRYLKGRGLSDETIRRFGLGYADQYGNTLYRYLKQEGYADEQLAESGLFRFDEKKGVSDQFWNRVMFPITDPRGRVIGFGGRVMGDGKPKYLNSPESYLFNKRRNLYALQYARATRRGFLILCEGYMDVITLHQNGFDNACASLGTALTEEQCSLLSRFTSEVLLLYDSDDAGVNAALRAIPLLKEAGIRPRVVSLSPYKDPDEFLQKESREALEERLQNAENAFLFETSLLVRNYRRKDPAEWTAFQREVARRLLSFPEEMERNNYLEAVCGRYGFDRDAMKKLVARMAAEGLPASTYEKPRPPAAKEMREDGLVTTQKLMLTYLANDPLAYEQTKTLVGPEDFSDPFLRTVAEALYKELEAGNKPPGGMSADGTGTLSEAKIISLFPDVEDQRRAAGIFHTNVRVQDGTEADQAFTDTVIRMMQEGNDARLKAADPSDMQAYARYIETKKRIEQFRKGNKLHAGSS